MRFNGTAVYVYNIVANTIPDNPNVVHGSNMTFSIDGALVGTFVHIPSSSTAYEYNYTVFSSSNLPNTEHTVVVQTTGDSVSSLILFDYAIYTFDDESEVASPSPISPSSSSTSTEVRLAMSGFIGQKSASFSGWTTLDNVGQCWNIFDRLRPSSH